MSTPANNTAQQYAAARAGSASAIAAVLKETLSPYGITPKVGLRQQDGLLYLALESERPSDPMVLLPLLQNSLDNLQIPWLRQAQVSGRVAGKPQPTWQQHLTLASPGGDPVTDLLRGRTGASPGGALTVGSDGPQHFYRYDYGAQGGTLDPATAPEIAPRPLPVAVLPPPFPQFVGRQRLIEDIKTALGTSQVVELHGAAGVGKTVLLRHLLNDREMTETFADGAVYLSGRRRQPDELLQRLYSAFFDSPVPYRPSYIQVQQALQEKRALVAIDDLSLDQADLDWLMAVLPQGSFIAVSREPLYDCGGTVLELEALPYGDSLQLIEQELGRALTRAEKADVKHLWQAIGGHPAQLRRAAAQVRLTLQGFSALTPPLVDDGEPQTSPQQRQLPLLIQPLTEDQRQLLGLLGATAGIALGLEQAGAMLQRPVADDLETLERLYLVAAEAGGYGLCRDLVAACQQALKPTPWLAQLVDYFTESKIRLTQPDTNTADALIYLCDWCAQAGRWPAGLKLAHALDASLSCQGRWDQWQQVLQLSLQAAQHTVNPAAEAWALHQLGTRALAVGDITLAESALSQALQLRQQVGDPAGQAATRHNLQLIATPGATQLEKTQPPAVRAATPTQPPATQLEPLPDAGPTLIPPVATALEPRPNQWPAALAAALGVTLLTAGLWWGIQRRSPAVPSLTFSGETLDFGQRELGTTSAPQTVLLTNSGDAGLQVSQVVLAADSDFRIEEDGCSAVGVIPPADSCAIVVTFRPTATGERSASLELTVAQENFRLQLLGSGTTEAVPNIAFAPAQLDFKELAVGAEETFTATIANDGTADLTIQGLTVQGSQGEEFAIANTNCTAVALAPDVSCTVQIRFKPQQGGARRANLVVTSNAPVAASLPLTGAGVKAAVPIPVDDRVTTPVNTPITIAVLDNDRDPAGGSLTLVSAGKAQSGQVQLNDNNTLTYRPSGQGATTDSFTYAVRNGRGEAAEGLVVVTITAAPVATAPQANPDRGETQAGQPVTVDVLANDVGDTISLGTFDSRSQFGGTVVQGQNGLIYTPAEGFSGVDRFSYIVRDRNGTPSQTAQVEILVEGQPVPSPQPDRATTPMDTAVTIDVLANDGDRLEIDTVESPSPAGATIAISDGVLTYRPAVGWAGTDQFTYTVRDLGGALSAPVTVTVEVQRVNAPPLAQDDSSQYRYGGQPQEYAIPVLDNDSDPDGDQSGLVIVAVTQGSFTTVRIGSDRRSLVYVPAYPPQERLSPTGFASDRFTYTVRDADGATSSATVVVSGFYPDAVAPS